MTPPDSEVVEHDGWWSIDTEFCQVTIEPRPVYCDRGRFIAKAFPRHLALGFDEQDGWPRYYFDWDRMLAEIDAWLKVRHSG
jgi:hypothetical protein